MRRKCYARLKDDLLDDSTIVISKGTIVEVDEYLPYASIVKIGDFVGFLAPSEQSKILEFLND